MQIKGKPLDDLIAQWKKAVGDDMVKTANVKYLQQWLQNWQLF